MADDVTMPRLSDSMEEGTILKWLVEQGGDVTKGEPLVEIESDKENATYDAEVDGKLVEILAKEGDTLAVGSPIARIEAAGANGGGDDRPSDADDADAGGSDATDSGDPEAGDADPAADTFDPETVKASPVAQRVAQDASVELESIQGSGPGGKIVKADVESAAKDGARGAKGEADVTELSRLQQTVSRRMAESKATAPDYSLTVDVDMTLAVELRERLKDQAEHPPSYNDIVVKAAANALREHTRVNGAYRDGKFESYSRVNVGIVVAANDAFVIPTVFDADTKSLGQIARDTYELAERVRDQTITPPEVAGGTFTVTNLGMYGIDEFTAVINPPQAAMLTVGSLKKRPAVNENGRVVALDQLRLSLVCDQRILYGADAAAFLAAVRELLEQPLALAL